MAFDDYRGVRKLELEGLSPVDSRSVIGHIVPTTSGTYDLGSSTYPFRNMYAEYGIFRGAPGAADSVVLNLGRMVDNPTTPLYEVRTDDVTDDLLIFQSKRYAIALENRRWSGTGSKTASRLGSDGSADSSHYWDLYGGNASNRPKVHIHASGLSYLSGGEFRTHGIYPEFDSAYDLGTVTRRWRNINAVSGHINSVQAYTGQSLCLSSDTAIFLGTNVATPWMRITNDGTRTFIADWANKIVRITAGGALEYSSGDAIRFWTTNPISLVNVPLDVDAYNADMHTFRPLTNMSGVLGDETHYWNKIFCDKGYFNSIQTGATLQSVSTTYSILITDSIIICDASGGAFTVTLPAAADVPVGKKISIKKTDASANAVTIDGDGVETIDGSETASLISQYEVIGVVSDGTEWWIV